MVQEAATRRVERRLAAIMAADVVGYSRLMGTDEEGTLAQLKAHRRELGDPIGGKPAFYSQRSSFLRNSFPRNGNSSGAAPLS